MLNAILINVKIYHCFKDSLACKLPSQLYAWARHFNKCLFKSLSLAHLDQLNRLGDFKLVFYLWHKNCVMHNTHTHTHIQIVYIHPTGRILIISMTMSLKQPNFVKILQLTLARNFWGEEYMPGRVGRCVHIFVIYLCLILWRFNTASATLVNDYTNEPHSGKTHLIGSRFIQSNRKVRSA